MRFWSAQGQSTSRTGAPREFGIRRRQAAVIVVTLGGIAALALWLQLQIYPNHDVAWVLWGAREMLHGAKYGRDIIEPNPPLAWYLSMPTSALAEWLNVPLDRPFTIAIVLAGILSSASLVRFRPLNMDRRHALVLASVAAVALVILPGREFGQREPLMMIAVLPYLALSGHRFQHGPAPRSSLAVAVGLSAGLGFALKPYFLAVPLLVELVLWLFGKRPQGLLRAENLSAAATIAAYAAWVLLFEQPYLRDVVPLVREIYWSFNIPLEVIAVPLLIQLLGAAGLAMLSFTRKDAMGIILSAAFCGFAFSYLVQAKGYHYHLMPVRTVALLLAARFMLDEELGRQLRMGVTAVAAALTLLWAVQFELWWLMARPGGPLYDQIEQINDSIARHAGRGGFLVVAVRTYPSFPAGVYARGRYVSRTNGQWFLPAVVQLRAAGRPSANVERHARDFLMHDLLAKPGLVLIDTNSKGHTQGPGNFDFLAFYGEDPAFRAEWSAYREIERIGQYRQFARVASLAEGRPR